MLARLPLVLCLFALSALVALPAPAEAPCDGTPAYSPCEIPFELSAADAAAHRNPYATVLLQVEFRSPRFKTYLMPGFWDASRNKMIVRFTPTEAGQWTYESPAIFPHFDGKESMFNAAASDRRVL